MSQSTKDKPASRDAKRARFGAKPKKAGGASPLVLVAGLAAVLVLIGGAVFALARPSVTRASPPSASFAAEGGPSSALVPTSATSGHDPYSLVTADKGAIRLPVAAFDDGKAHFYTYMHQGQPIEFLVLKSSDGVVRAALNACDVCYPARKGYHQEGDYMVCNNCGRRFPSTQINEVQGGCNPSPLTRTLEGDVLVIPVTDVVSGLAYFTG